MPKALCAANALDESNDKCSFMPDSLQTKAYKAENCGDWLFLQHTEFLLCNNCILERNLLLDSDDEHLFDNCAIKVHRQKHKWKNAAVSDPDFYQQQRSAQL